MFYAYNHLPFSSLVASFFCPIREVYLWSFQVGIALQSSVWPIVPVSSMALLGTVEAVQKCTSVYPRSRSRCNRKDHGFLNSFSAVNFQVRLWWHPAASGFWIESTGRNTQDMLEPPVELPEYFCGVGFVLLQCPRWTALADAVLGY